MIVELRRLKPNPWRDFEVDPIDQEAVQRLKASVEEHGFWGGVVCRKREDEYEIAAGHHRVAAALEAGIERADVFVSETLTDDDMIRIYARENSTQRGAATGTARAGSVAAALRKALFDFLKNSSENRVAQKRGRPVSADDIGRDYVLKYLTDDPATSPYTVQEDLKSLKVSGHYARILREVRDRLQYEWEQAVAQAHAAREKAEAARREEEERAAAEEAKRWEDEAEKAGKAATDATEAAEKANKQETVFDFAGVAEHLKNPNQIRAFRDMVLSPALQEIIPVEQQADVAARVVDRATKDGEDSDGPSGRYIRETLYQLVLVLFRERHRREMTDEERERIIGGEWQREAREQQNIFLSALRGAKIQGEKFIRHLQEAPEGTIFAVSRDVMDLLGEIARIKSDMEGKG